MKIDYRVLMELQALRNMNSSNPTDENQQSMFKEIFDQVLVSSELTKSKESLQLPFTLPNQQNIVTSSIKGENQYKDLINTTSMKYNINPELLTAVIQHESNFNPSAKSNAGAIGLMQLMPKTAVSMGITNPYDPVQNIEGGAKYLRKMLDRYENNISLALAAYNAGPGNVDKYGGIPPFTETLAYVEKITNSYNG